VVVKQAVQQTTSFTHQENGTKWLVVEVGVDVVVDGIFGWGGFVCIACDGVWWCGELCGGCGLAGWLRLVEIDVGTANSSDAP
jgi:hypothetical protein